MSEGGKVVQASRELLRIFEAANRRFFAGQLKVPEITVQSAGYRRAYGWCSGGRIWRSAQGAGGNWEINICAEHLSRTVYETVGTLLHEIAHLSNLQRGVADCTSNQYHNQFFKGAAEQAGLSVQRMAPYGWAQTSLTPETQEWVGTLNVDESAFSVFRAVFMPEQPVPPPATGGSVAGPDEDGAEEGDAPAGTGSPPVLPPRRTRRNGSKMKKWTCGCTIVRCAVQLEARCGRCGKRFRNQE
ncbi:MAG: SprT-like domain-containing protein [Bacillota bacterium]